MSFLAELQRRNVPRAAVLYVGAVWALAQGIAQLSPAVGLPDMAARWFLIACCVGFPFWLAFAWLYEWTPQGLKRESGIAADVSITRSTGRRLDRAIIAVLAIAVVLLLADRFVLRKGDDAAIPEKSIAVLPLLNESGDPQQEYFSDGLSEDLITALSQFAGLKVISRNSAFQFRDSKLSSDEIGKRLGVAHLLEGSLQRAGGMLRISARLVNAADGSILWSQRYDRPYKDLFALQDEITQACAEALKTQLLAGESTKTQGDRPPGGNVEAYNAFLQGRFHNRRGSEADYRKAIEVLELAIRLDPRYAAPHAELANVLTAVAGSVSGAEQQQAYARAREEAHAALELDPDSSLARVANGFLLLYADFDWAGARAEFRRAAESAPNDGVVLTSLASLEATLGRSQRAVEWIRKALATDPLHGNRYYWLSTYLSGLSRLDEAEQAIRKAIELQPAADAYHQQLAAIAIQRGDARAALAAAQQENPGVWQREAMALALQVGPDRVAADAALQSLVDKNADGAAYQIAQTYALRRDPDNTFKWLERSLANRDPGIQFLLFDPFILRYRDDPRFAAFCRRVGLPATTDAKAMP